MLHMVQIEPHILFKCYYKGHSMSQSIISMSLMNLLNGFVHEGRLLLKLVLENSMDFVLCYDRIQDMANQFILSFCYGISE